MATVDVIIATYNRPARIARCLEQLRAQVHRDFRVIVVDDCSEPPVTATLPASAREGLDVVFLRTAANGGPALARNLGIEASTAPFIAFIDDDVDADPMWLVRHLEAHRRPGRIVTVGPLLAPADWRPTAWNAWEAWTLQREYERMAQGVYAPTWRQFFTGNAMVRRRDLVEAGGFHAGFTRAEDIELALRLHRAGATFVFEQRAVGWHYAHRSLASWLNIPREYARFDAGLDRMYPDIDWLEVVTRELGQRKAPMRLARRVLDAVGPARASAGLVACARVAHAARAGGAGLRLLSLAYDVEYRASLRRELREPGAALPPASNLASTPPQPPLPTVTR